MRNTHVFFHLPSSHSLAPGCCRVAKQFRDRRQPCSRGTAGCTEDGNTHLHTTYSHKHSRGNIRPPHRCCSQPLCISARRAVVVCEPSGSSSSSSIGVVAVVVVVRRVWWWGVAERRKKRALACARLRKHTRTLACDRDGRPLAACIGASGCGRAAVQGKRGAERCQPVLRSTRAGWVSLSHFFG